MIFCPECDEVASAGAGACPGCGTPFLDVYASVG
jgi:hypothetical protein